jgi:hypothetical protein
MRGVHDWDASSKSQRLKGGLMASCNGGSNKG